MAISARQAQLLNQRGRTSSLYSGNKIKILSPGNSAVNSIAKQTANSELAVMTTKYNSGQISNTEMRSFLEKTMNNPGISQADKADVGVQLKDFDARIMGDQLQATYKAAPDGSLQQLQATQALSAYYKNRASTMQPDTPAYATNMDNAAAYDNKVLDIQKTVATKNRQNVRYLREQQVNAIPSGTSEKASAKAEMWKELYNQAITDGDTTAANQYATNYQQEATNADTLSTREQTVGTKTELTKEMNNLVNLYHDGQINEQQYLQALADISPRIDATGDYGLINSLNRTTDTIQKNLDKGGIRRGTTASGIPFTMAAKGGAGGGAVTDGQMNEFNYTDDKRIYQALLQKGKRLDGSPYTAQDYANDMKAAVDDRATYLNEKMAEVYAIASENPNARIIGPNGRKAFAGEVYQSLVDDLTKVEEEQAVVDGGSFGVVQSEPGKGKAKPTYQIVDTSSSDFKTSHVQDENGVWYQTGKKINYMSEDRLNRFKAGATGADGTTFSNGYLYDASGNQIGAVRRDSQGRIYYEAGGQNVKVYDDNGKYKDVPIQDVNKKITSLDFDNQQAASASAQLKKQADEQAKFATSSAGLKQAADNKARVQQDAIVKAQQNNGFPTAQQMGVKPGTSVTALSRVLPGQGLSGNVGLGNETTLPTAPKVVAPQGPLVVAGTPSVVQPQLKQAINPTGSTPISLPGLPDIKNPQPLQTVFKTPQQLGIPTAPVSIPKSISQPIQQGQGLQQTVGSGSMQSKPSNQPTLFQNIGNWWNSLFKKK